MSEIWKIIKLLSRTDETNVEVHRISDCTMSECPVAAGEEGPPQVLVSVPSDREDTDPRNMMPPANQQPSPDQPFPLPTERQKSSIPRSGTEDNWVYPSQQMFYNALRRKGWEFGPEDLEQSDMDHIIKIHNANNESAWEEVQD